MKAPKNPSKKVSAKLRFALEELTTIQALGNRLISTLDVKEILSSIVNIVPGLLNVSGCIVRIADEAKSVLRLEAASGVSSGFREDAYRLSMGEGISGIVAKNKVPIAISDIRRDRRFKYHNECISEGMQSLLAAPIIFKNKTLGTVIAFSKKRKHFNKSEINLLSIFAAHAAIALNNAILHKNVHLNYYNTITTLVKTIEARDPYTCGHSERVTNYAVKIAKSINLSRSEMEVLLYAGKLHDIGKIAIPDFILNKPDTLTSAEWSEIQTHPVKGIEMLTKLKFLGKCLPPIRSHHERYDGKGYPDRLKGEEIPLLARILSIADAFDAMTSKRPYRGAFKICEAIEELERNSETQFDPRLTELFISALRKKPHPKITKVTSTQPIHLAS